MPAVRVAVLEGLQLLVDNQHAQPVLSVSDILTDPLRCGSQPSTRCVTRCALLLPMGATFSRLQCPI